MPQLNPTPWFFILAFSWLIFLFVIIPYTLSHSSPNAPTPQNARTPELTPWHWQWA